MQNNNNNKVSYRARDGDDHIDERRARSATVLLSVDPNVIVNYVSKRLRQNYFE